MLQLHRVCSITQRQTQAHTYTLTHSLSHTHTHTTVWICLAFTFNTHGLGKCLKSQKCIIIATAKLRHQRSHEQYLWQDSHSDAKTNPPQKYTHNTQNGPVNMLDLIRKRFGSSQLWPLWIARIGPDSMCQIRLPISVSVPFFQRRHGT